MALSTWNGRISPVFDVARQVLILEIEKDRVVSRHEEILPGTEPSAQVSRLLALAPHTLICGAISIPLANLLAASNIRVIPFIAGDIEQVVGAWLVGVLPNHAFSMPGCCGQRRRCRGEGGKRRNGEGYVNRKDNPLEKTQKFTEKETI